MYLLNVDVIYAEESYPMFDHGILFRMPELLKVVYQESEKVNKEQGTSCDFLSLFRILLGIIYNLFPVTCSWQQNRNLFYSFT